MAVEYIIRGITESQAKELRRILRQHRSLASLASQLSQNHFGVVIWSREDIRSKFVEANSAQPTSKQIQAILDTYQCRHIDDRMVENGWEVIEDAIRDVC